MQFTDLFSCCEVRSLLTLSSISRAIESRESYKKYKKKIHRTQTLSRSQCTKRACKRNLSASFFKSISNPTGVPLKILSRSTTPLTNAENHTARPQQLNRWLALSCEKRKNVRVINKRFLRKLKDVMDRTFFQVPYQP